MNDSSGFVWLEVKESGRIDVIFQREPGIKSVYRHDFRSLLLQIVDAHSDDKNIVRDAEAALQTTLKSLASRGGEPSRLAACEAALREYARHDSRRQIRVTDGRPDWEKWEDQDKRDEPAIKYFKTYSET